MSSLHSKTRATSLRPTDILHLQRDPDDPARQDLGLTGQSILGPMAARAPLSGLDIASSGKGVTTQAGADLAQSDIFIRRKFVTPATRDATERHFGGLCANPASNDNSIRISNPASSWELRLYVRATTTSATVSSGFSLLPLTAYDLVLTVNATTHEWVIYLSGVSVASGTLTGSAQTEFDAISALDYTVVGNTNAGAQGTDSVMLLAEHGNVALAADEVGLLYNFGWPALPHYVHPSGGGNLATSDFSSVDNLNFSSTKSTISANIDTDADGAGLPTSDNWLRKTATTTGGLREYFFPGLTTGKRYRLGYDFIMDSDTVDDVGIGAYAAEGYRHNDVSNPATAVIPRTLQTHQTEFTSSGGLLALGQCSGSGGNSSEATVSDRLYLKNVIVDKIGLCGSWDFSEGAGYQNRDLSGGGRPMNFTTTGVSRLRRGDLLQVYAETTHASGSDPKQVNGQAILEDLGYRLLSYRAKMTDGGTLDIGNISGGAQIASAAAMTINVGKNLTLASGGETPTTVNVWAKPSVACTVSHFATYVRERVL